MSTPTVPTGQEEHWPARYADRRQAGQWLASRLRAYAGRSDVQTLGLPRGGVATGAAVAVALSTTLDVFVVRKLGVPWHPELAMGAVASGGVRVLNDDVVDHLHIAAEEIESVSKVEIAELQRRERAYRGELEPIELGDKVAILVDDGLATGATARAAVAAARALQPRWLVLAVPVAPQAALSALRDAGNTAPDEIVCGIVPQNFDAVGSWYDDFRPLTDAEVHQILRNPRTPAA